MKPKNTKPVERTVTIPPTALARIASVEQQIAGLTSQRTLILETVLETAGITGNVEFLRAKGDKITVRVTPKA